MRGRGPRGSTGTSRPRIVAPRRAGGAPPPGAEPAAGEARWLGLAWLSPAACSRKEGRRRADPLPSLSTTPVDAQHFIEHIESLAQQRKNQVIRLTEENKAFGRKLKQAPQRPKLGEEFGGAPCKSSGKNSGKAKGTIAGRL